MKTKFQKKLDALTHFLRNLSRNMIVTVVVTFTAMGTVWLYAAFTEPLAGPADSDQDFAQNILGANNADNDFDSSAVVANADGSIIERQQYIADNMALNSEVGDATDAASMSGTLFAGQQKIYDDMASDRGPVVAMSAEYWGYYHGPAAAYCYGLSAVAAVAMDGDTSTTYTDWRLPTMGEAVVFEGTITSTNNVWTATPYMIDGVAGDNWIRINLSNGDWYHTTYNSATGYVRCVR